MFNTDFKVLTEQLMVDFLLKAESETLPSGFHINWLHALNYPIRDMQAKLLTYRASTRVELSYNSQKLLFEKALNDKFDPVLRRIYINAAGTDDGPLYLNFAREQQPPKYVYLASEGKPPLYLRHGREFGSSADITVFVPDALEPREPAIRKIILRLKYACFTYTITYL